MKTAAIYARVSSDQQKEDKTIASQTAALMAFASSQGYSVPAEWIFEDEGFSGATLVRPGLERVRDLVAEGQIQAVLVLSPDRLSRKYAYQVLLTEEWLRHGVETIFIKAPQSQTPEDQLLLQFQGMIAEYERAQILERSRRGKRHRAKQGEVSVLSGAPYGYRYVRKTEERAAYYEVIEAQAEVVRQVFDLYTAQALSIGAITRRLNELGVPTRKEQTCWERSTIWAMLRNPAYRGMACFGKTQEAARQHRGNRPYACGPIHRDAARAPLHETRRISGSRFLCPRWWMSAPSIWRRSDCKTTRGSPHAARSSRASCRAWCTAPIAATRCIGLPRAAARARSTTTDAWVRTPGAIKGRRGAARSRSGSICWRTPCGAEVARLLEDPALIQAELTRRVEAARTSHPAKQHQDRIERELLQAQRRVERLLTAYQEDLLSLDELRRRMPELRQRETRLKAELESLSAQLADQATYLRLAHTLGEFLERLRTQVQDLDVLERQRVVRLLVKEVVVGRRQHHHPTFDPELEPVLWWVDGPCRSGRALARRRQLGKRFAIAYVERSESAAGQRAAGRGGSRAGAQGALLRALRRRLQRLRREPQGGRTGPASAAQPLCEAAAEGQRDQDGSGGGLGAQVPGLLLLAEG